jgi:hypothetical protein
MPRCFSISIQSDVAWRAALRALTAAGDLDRAGKQQQLFSQRGFAGVGVGNDGEGAAPFDLAGDFFRHNRPLSVRVLGAGRGPDSVCVSKRF